MLASVPMLSGSSCRHSMACPQVADEDSLQIWRVSAIVLNKQLQETDKGWSSSLGVGWIHWINDLS
jgi:hypothetical protein